MEILGRLEKLTEADKEANFESEIREDEIERADDEWDIDETCFKDEGEITVEDLKNSPALKIAYGRFISQSNWCKWVLGC
jgi:hypothetical protein